MAEQVPVGELLSFVIGGGWGAEEPAAGLTACRVIRGADIPAAQAGTISAAPRRFETPKRLASRTLRAGDLILEVSGGSKTQPTGRTVLVSARLLSQSSTPVIPASFCRLIRPDQSRVDSRYLSYWLSEMYRAGRTWAYQTQSTGIANFQMAVFEREEIVRLPSLPEQQRIAGVLGAFDDLIETNRKLARGCEEALFAFVAALAFDVPTVFFGSVAKRENDRVLPSQMKESEPYLGLEHFATAGLGLEGRGNAAGITSQSQRFECGDVLYGKLRPYFQKVARPGFGGVCSGEIWVLRALDGYPQAALHAVVQNKRFSDMATAGSGGTRMPRADWKHMAEYPVPDVRGVLSRSEIQALEDLWGAACELRAEADELARQRDELLPLLMSGKVRVSEVEGSLP